MCQPVTKDEQSTVRSIFSTPAVEDGRQSRPDPERNVVPGGRKKVARVVGRPERIHRIIMENPGIRYSQIALKVNFGAYSVSTWLKTLKLRGIIFEKNHRYYSVSQFSKPRIDRHEV